MSLIFICFDLIQIFEEFASLSFQVSWRHQFWTDFKKILDFGFFPLGLSVFQILGEAHGFLSMKDSLVSIVLISFSSGILRDIA